MNELPAALLQALSAAAVAVVITVAVVVFSRPATARAPKAPRNGGPSADEALNRLRFPARALERLLVVGIVVVAAAVLLVFEVDRDVRVGAGAVAAGLGWMLWRGTFLSLQVGSRRG